MTTIEPIGLPSWGETYVVRLPEVVRLAFVECIPKITLPRYTSEVRAKLIARAVLDGKFKRVFRDGDWKRIARKPEAELARIYEIACRLNGIPTE